MRTFEMEAAVGLLRRSAALVLKVAFLIGVGTAGAAAFRAFARDAAVGANRPEGVLGREVPAVRVEPGVFGREA